MTNSKLDLMIKNILKYFLNMLKKNNLEKVILEINKKEKNKLSKLLNYFDNVFYKFLEQTIYI